MPENPRTPDHSPSDLTRLQERIAPHPDDPVTQPIAPAARQPFLAAKHWACSHTKQLTIAAAALVLVVAIVVGVVVANKNAGPATAQVRSDLASADIEANLTNSLYADNKSYQLQDFSVGKTEHTGANERLVTAEAHYTNSSFEVQAQVQLTYGRASQGWELSGWDVVKTDATPLAGVDKAQVLADIQNICKMVAPRDGTTLERIYDGGDFEVTKVDFDATAMSSFATISARKEGALYTYAATITAEFRWQESQTTAGEGTWELAGAAADDAAFERAQASPAGMWSSTLESTTTSAVLFNTGICHAGASDPLTMTVHSFDTDTGIMSADIAFVVHNHAALADDTDSDTGDARVRLTDVTLNLDPDTLQGSLASDDVPSTSTDNSQLSWRLRFTSDGGTWRIVVESGVKSESLWGLGTTTFTDTYVLARS